MNGEFNRNNDYSSNDQMNNINNFNSQGNNTYTSNNNYPSNDQMNNINSFNSQGNNNHMGNITTNNSGSKIISKRYKIIITTALILSLVMIISNGISNWFSDLYVVDMVRNGGEFRTTYNVIIELLDTFAYIIPIVITILSIVFLIIDKKDNKNNNIDVYVANILIFAIFLFFGPYPCPLLYSIGGLIFGIKYKNNKFILILSILTLLIFIVIKTGLIGSIIKNIDVRNGTYNNKEVVIKDEDTSHIVTSFDKVVDDFGNNVLENKYYKIQNVKIGNITASIYIDYTVNAIRNITTVNMKITHGDKVKYNETTAVNNSNRGSNNYFNLSYLKYYDNMVIFATSECNQINQGVCNYDYDYRDVVVFTNDMSKSFSSAYLSVFDEDKNVYAYPYNSFRVYNIKVNGDEILFYTIADNYQDLFKSDYDKYDENCNNKFWVASGFDMQRTYKTKITITDDNKYIFDDLNKISSITYYDYCTNNNVLDLKK